jgi:hypothetical protein
MHSLDLGMSLYSSLKDSETRIASKEPSYGVQSCDPSVEIKITCHTTNSVEPGLAKGASHVQAGPLTLSHASSSIRTNVHLWL